MQVKDIMHTGVEWVEPATPIMEVAKKMRELDVGAIPVGENDRLVGMVTDRDIACRVVAEGTDLAQVTAGDVMTKGIVYCRDTEDVADATHLMENKRIRRLPVIDEDKRMVGMLSLGDISHGTTQELTGEVMQAVSDHHT